MHNTVSALIVAGQTTHWALHLLRARGHESFDIDTVIINCSEGNYMTGNILSIINELNRLQEV